MHQNCDSTARTSSRSPDMAVMAVAIASRCSCSVPSHRLCWQVVVEDVEQAVEAALHRSRAVKWHSMR